MSRRGFVDWLRTPLTPEVVRRRTHRGALGACLVFGVVVAIALLRPAKYPVGPVVVNLTSLRNPLLELGASLLVALATADRAMRIRLEAPRRLVALWSGWTIGGRVFAVALAAKIAITVVTLARVPDSYLVFRRIVRTRVDRPIEWVFDNGGRYAQFEIFFERCRRELPPDARVLYYGRGEGQILAYVLYPRPVFMHPVDRYVAWVGHQALDLGRAIPEDHLFPGNLPRPDGAPELAAFIEAHRITHVVQFVESDLASCRIAAVR